MMHAVFTVYDHKAKAYMQPFYTPNAATAVRAFTDAVNGGNELFENHPEDFTLYQLGLFDDESGKFVQSSSPDPVVKAVQVKRELRPTPLEEHITSLDKKAAAD